METHYVAILLRIRKNTSTVFIKAAWDVRPLELAPVLDSVKRNNLEGERVSRVLTVKEIRTRRYKDHPGNSCAGKPSQNWPAETKVSGGYAKDDGVVDSRSEDAHGAMR